ncbi:MAG TPA: hypothetical protein VFJ22_16120 [Dermatophilaceae bacterium]|nr:hypothetical protein [Dermatophilaceae bacterium]
MTAQPSPPTQSARRAGNTVQRTVPGREMSRWRKRLFLGLAHNAASPIEYFRLPEDRTVAMGAVVVL